MLGAFTESAEGRRTGNVFAESDKTLLPSREPAVKELTVLNLELANEDSFDFLDN